jgi:magnesium chelatase subunit D
MEVEPLDAETVIAAIQAALPPGVLDQSRLEGSRSSKAAPRQGAGASAASARRGRPVGSRAGTLRGGDRLHLPETLRAASPWQRLRAAAGEGPLIRVRPEDLRIRRFSQRREATTIFVVDASGSAAFQRLAEAKGAVELLLAKAYVSRARVALVAFRSLGAEVLLEPTRSLARAKRSLADLPGGGGTPLAAGLDAALTVAVAETARGRTPLLVVLTDGRANIGRGGVAGRPQAELDALAAARGVRAAGIDAVFIDTSPRAQPGGDRFARAMGAAYAPLPYLQAAAVSELVGGYRPGRG